MSTTRTFRVTQGVLVVPQAVAAGPGATHLRLRAGDTLTIPATRCGRFIRGRLLAGDLVEVITAPAATAPTTAAMPLTAPKETP